jgi:hypothetical protein
MAGWTRIAHDHSVLGNISERFPDQIGCHALALATLNRLVAEKSTVIMLDLAVAHRVLIRDHAH